MLLAGFLAEVLNGGANFFDEDGNFTKLVNMQHMTIYAIFVLHGIVDLMMFFGAPLPQGLDYATIALAMAWYGMSFYFHAGMPGKPPMEVSDHNVLRALFHNALMTSVNQQFWNAF